MPNNWNTYKLDEICNRITDGSHSSPKELKNGVRQIATVKDMNDYGFSLEQCKRISDKDFESLKNQDCVPEKGDVLFSKDGTIGKVLLFDFDFKIGILSSIAIFRPKTELIDSQFLSYYLKEETNNTFIRDNYRSGSAIPRIILRDFKKYELTIPPLQEQQFIASILSAIDDKIENNLAINKTLEEMAMALYKHWFVDFGPFQEGEFVESELGMIPKGWEVKSIEYLLSIKPLNGLYKKSEFQGYGNRWLKMSSVYGLDIITNQKMELISVTDNEIEKFGCIKDDIVFGRTSLVLEGIGKCAIIKCEDNVPIFESNLFRIRLDKKNVFPDIIYIFFKTKYGRDEVKKLARQTAAVSITSKDLTNIKIALPNILVQNEVAEKLDFYINKQLENIKENQILTQLRETLLPQLISGALRLKEFRE
jgi:type I restriction enzyme S subunit